MNNLGYLSIDELKSKLSEGIWVLTGGVLAMQNMIKSAYSGEELQEELAKAQSVLKLQTKNNKLYVTIIDKYKELISTRIYNTHQAKLCETVDHQTILILRNDGEMIHSKNLKQTKKLMIKKGFLTAAKSVIDA